ncbi:F-box only protein 6 isoform X2 [Pogona vitticeps]
MSQSGVKRWLRSFLRKKATIQDLPEEVLLDILSRVPKKDLILHCRLVCSLWRDLVDQPALWSRKCQHLGFNPAASGGPIQDWRTFYLHHSTPNLVKNPCGKENLDFWDLRRTSWMTISYNLPLFHKQIPCPPLDVEKCFVVAGPLIGQGVKSQRITLRDEGYSDRLMDETRPRIVVNDCWYRPIPSTAEQEVNISINPLVGKSCRSVASALESGRLFDIYGVPFFIVIPVFSLPLVLAKEQETWWV